MLISQRPTLSEEVINDSRSQFVIEPLEPGFGYTLGNSLRRTLLSSIPGAAVTSIRIDGVLHEFTTVPGVKEDVTDIILNLKSLVVSSEEDEPVTMYLRKQGPGDAGPVDDVVQPAFQDLQQLVTGLAGTAGRFGVVAAELLLHDAVGEAGLLLLLQLLAVFAFLDPRAAVLAGRVGTLLEGLVAADEVDAQPA